MGTIANDTADNVYKATKKAARRFSKRSDHLKEYAGTQLDGFLDDVEDLIQRLGNIADADVERLRSKITEDLGDLRERAADKVDEVSRRARTAVGATNEYVRDRPWTAIGVAAAVALLVGVGVKAASSRR